MPQDDSGRKLCSKQRKTLSVSHRNGEWVLLGKKKPFNMTASSSVGREVTAGEVGKTGRLQAWRSLKCVRKHTLYLRNCFPLKVQALFFQFLNFSLFHTGKNSINHFIQRLTLQVLNLTLIKTMRNQSLIY